MCFTFDPFSTSGHKVAMPEIGQHLDFILKFLDALLGLRVTTLDCHLQPTSYLTVVYIPKPTFA